VFKRLYMLMLGAKKYKRKNSLRVLLFMSRVE